MTSYEEITALDGITLHHRRVEGSGATLHVVTAGSGPPVVLLHGFPEHWWSWRKQIPALVRAGYCVWAPDLRGYNRSARPDSIDAYALPHLVADVAALARATGVPKVHVAGHDWGGVIAWTFAGYYPELVDRLLILNAPHIDIYLRTVWNSTQAIRSVYVPFFTVPWLPERALSAFDFLLLGTAIDRLTIRKHAFTAADLRRYTDALSSPGALSAALAYYRANVWGDAMRWARQARIQANTRVIWGMNDPCLAPSLLDGLDSVAPRVHVHRIPACGHWVHAEAPDDVNHSMITFLASPE